MYSAGALAAAAPLYMFCESEYAGICKIAQHQSLDVSAVELRKNQFSSLWQLQVIHKVHADAFGECSSEESTRRSTHQAAGTAVHLQGAASLQCCAPPLDSIRGQTSFCDVAFLDQTGPVEFEN
jgi:hypothetical protein